MFQLSKILWRINQAIRIQGIFSKEFFIHFISVFENLLQRSTEMKLRKHLLKSFALFLAILFVFDTVCWSAPGVSVSEEIPSGMLNGLSVRIPLDMGEIRSSYRAPGNKGLVVHIQDAHGNYEAQQNIRNILKHLSDRYHFDLIFKEGANVKLDPSLFHFFEDRALDLKVADLLMRHGEFSGAELFLLEQSIREENSPVEMHGIEDAETYSRDFALFREMVQDRESVLACVQQMKFASELLETRIFSKELRDFAKEWKKASRTDAQIGSYLETLAQKARSLLSLDVKDPQYQESYEAILRILKLKELEPGLDFKKVQAERAALIGFLTGKIDAQLLAWLSDFGGPEGQEAKAERELPRFLFEKIFAQAGNQGLDIRNYPEFVHYAEYRIFQSEIETEKLFQEMSQLADRIFEALAKSEAEKSLLGLIRDIALSEKLLTLELSRAELSEAEKKGKELQPAELLKRMKNFSDVRLDLPAEEVLDGFYRKALEFYRIAQAREKFFLKKMNRVMSEKEQTVSVIVTGGFHTEGIEEALREMGYSYLSVSPRISKVGDSHKLYLQAMLGETVILDRAQIDNVAELIPWGDQEVMAQDRPFLLHRRALVEQAVKAVAQAASLGGGAKYRGMTPDELDELIGRLQQTGQDVSTDPWLNQIIGEVRFILREHLQGVDWGDYVRERLARWVASAQRELESVRQRHEAELAKLRDRERMASFSPYEATRLKSEVTRWSAEVARRTEQVGRVSELLATPQNLLNGASQILRDTARRSDQRFAYFRPSPEDRARILRLYDEMDRADFLVAFETEEGIFILDGLPQRFEGMDLEGERLMRALLVNAGAERFLSAQGVDPELAHLISEDLERIVLMSPEEIRGGISFDLPQLSRANSPLDQAIIEFGRAQSAASAEAKPAVPEPPVPPAAPEPPAAVPEPVSPALPEPEEEGEVRTFSDFEGLFEYLRQSFPLETIPGVEVQYVRVGEVFESGRNVLVMKNGAWYLTVLRNEENFWEIRVIRDGGVLSQPFVSIPVGDIRSTPLEITSNKIQSAETTVVRIRVKIKIPSSRLDLIHAAYQRGEVQGKPPFEELFSVVPVPGAERSEFFIEINRRGEISAADAAAEPAMPAEPAEPASSAAPAPGGAEPETPVARQGYPKKGITDEQVLEAYQLAVDHMVSPLWDEAGQTVGLPTVNEISDLLEIVPQSLQGRIKSRLASDTRPLGYLTFRLRYDPGAQTTIRGWLETYNRVNPENTIAVENGDYSAYAQHLFEIYLQTMRWMRDKQTPAPERDSVLILNRLFELVGIPLVDVPEPAAARPAEPAALVVPVPAVPAAPEKPVAPPELATPVTLPAAPPQPAAPTTKTKAPAPSKGVTDEQIADAFVRLLENIDHVRIPVWDARGILRGIPSFREIAEAVGCKTGEVKSRWEHHREKGKLPFSYLPVDSEPAVSEIARGVDAYNRGATEDGRITSSPEELFSAYVTATDFLQGDGAALADGGRISELNRLFGFLGIPQISLPEGALTSAGPKDMTEGPVEPSPAAPAVELLLPAESLPAETTVVSALPAGSAIEPLTPPVSPAAPTAPSEEEGSATERPATATGITKGQIVQAYQRILAEIDHDQNPVWSGSGNWRGLPSFREVAQELSSDARRIKTSDIQKRWETAKGKNEEPFNYLPTRSEQTVVELSTLITAYNRKVKEGAADAEARTVTALPEELIDEYQKAVLLLRGEGEEQPNRAVIAELNRLFEFIGIPVLELPGEAPAEPVPPQEPSGPETPEGPAAGPETPAPVVVRPKGITDEQFMQAYGELIDHVANPLWDDTGAVQGIPSAIDLGQKLDIVPQSVRGRLKNRRERGLRPLSDLTLRTADAITALPMIQSWLESYNRANPENQIAIPGEQPETYATRLFSSYQGAVAWMADKDSAVVPVRDDAEILNRLFEWVGIPVLELPPQKSASQLIDETIDQITGEMAVRLQDWETFIHLVSEGSGQPVETVLGHERIGTIRREIIDRGNAAVEAALAEADTAGMTLKSWPVLIRNVSDTSGQPADFVLRNEQMWRVSQGMIKTADRVYANFSELEETLNEVSVATGLSLDQILEDRRIQALYLTLLSKMLRNVVEATLVHKYAWRTPDWDSAQAELLAHPLFSKVPRPILEQRIRALNLSRVFEERITAERRTVEGGLPRGESQEPQTPETRQANLQQIFDHLTPRLQHEVDTIASLEDLLGQPHNGNEAGILGLLGLAQKDLSHASLEQASGSIRSARKSAETSRRREGAGMKGSEGAHELAARTKERAIYADVAWSILSNPELLRIYFRLYPTRWDGELLGKLLDAGLLDEFFPTEAGASHETYPDYFDVLGINISRDPAEVWEWDAAEQGWKARSSFLRSVKFGTVQKAIQALPDRRDTRWGLIRDDFGGRFRTSAGLQHVIGEWAEVYVPKPERPEAAQSLGMPQAVADYLELQERSAQAVLQVALSHEEGGITEGVLYLPGSPEALRWFFEQVGMRSEAYRTASKEAQAFNADASFARFSEETGISLQTPESNIPFILFDTILNLKDADAAEVAAQIANAMNPGDLVVAVRQDGVKHPVIDKLLIEAAQRNVRVKTISQELINPDSIGSLVKNFEVQPVSISPWKEGDDVTLDFDGTKIKLNRKTLLSHGVDPLQLVSLIRQLADNPEERKERFLKAGFELQSDGSWVVGNGFVQLIQKIYAEAGAQAAIRRAA